jgi:hypothetical protein
MKTYGKSINQKNWPLSLWKHLKKALKLILPGVVFYIPRFLNFKRTKMYCKYRLEKYSNDDSIPPNLKSMIRYYMSSSFSLTSTLWAILLCAHIERIKSLGYENFKYNISRNYGLGATTLDTPYVFDLFECIGGGMNTDLA